MTPQEFEKRLVEFSDSVLSLCVKLEKSNHGRHLSDQLFRSGSSSALNYAEARGAESRRDFKHKMKIVLKELRESHVALQIVERTRILNSPGDLSIVSKECNELISIMVSSLKTIDRNDRMNGRK